MKLLVIRGQSNNSLKPCCSARYSDAELQSNDVLRHTGAKRSDRLAPIVTWEALFYSSMAAAATAAVYVSALALRLA